jgi:TRAP-type mannitol/chloroaromatic compound transport system permease small subunit
MRIPFELIADGIDRVTMAIGRAASLCCPFIVAAEFAIVVMRYGFGVGSIAVQEAVVYAGATLFLLAAAWTLQVGGHVRVDIFYERAKPRTKALIDLFGALVLLIPFAGALGLLSVPYAAHAWAVLERSRETSGLPFVYLLKTLIPLFAFLIGLQGVAQVIRAALVLIGPAVHPSR